MVDAVGRVHRIDPLRCREHVEAQFGTRRMASQYLEAYERILAGDPVVAAVNTVPYAGLGDLGTAVAVGAVNPERLAAATDAY